MYKKKNSNRDPIEVENSRKRALRIQEIRELLCKNDNSIFSVKMGVSKQYASGLCTASERITDKTLEKILTTFPEVSRTWLYFGEGEMLTSSNTNDQQNVHVGGDNIVNGSSKNTLDGIDRLLDIISSQQLTIHELTEQNKILTQIIASKI